MSATKNKLFYGDNLEVLRKYIKDDSVDLCYIDPPFNSKRTYNQIYNNVGNEDKAQAQAFVDTWTWNYIANEGFDEIMGNKNGVFTKQSINLILGLEKVLGKGSLLSYLVSMTQRIAEIYRILKPTGSFYLHCDPTASHYLKLVLDTIFCSQGGDYRNEVRWKRQPVRGAKATGYQYARNSDCILFYTKSNKSIWNNPYKQYDENFIKNKFRKDGNGRYFRDCDLGDYSQNSIEKFEAEGRIYITKNGNKRLIRYLDEEKGEAIGDIWSDIAELNSMAKERLGYPTQKPEALLERIIEASSNEGDLILDAYCGCGTTIAVAEKLKRNWIGIDITYQSISLIMKRLEDSFGKTALDNVVLTGIPEDFESAIALANKQDDRLRKEFEKWVVLTYSKNRAIINDKKGGDGGIDGSVFMLDKDEENKEAYKEVIFSVKSNKSLSPTVVRDLYGTMEREKAAIGYLLTLYAMPNLVKESAKYGNYENKLVNQTYPKIEIICVEDILQGKKMHLPTSLEVLKKAERKGGGDLPDIFG